MSLSYDEAKEVARKTAGVTTDDPWTNFLIDCAKDELTNFEIEDPRTLDEWEDLREKYEREVEALTSSSADFEPYSVEEVREEFLQD